MRLNCIASSVLPFNEVTLDNGPVFIGNLPPNVYLLGNVIYFIIVFKMSLTIIAETLVP